jgi:hypothetical protein
MAGKASKPSKALLQLTDQTPEALLVNVQGVALLGGEAAAMAAAMAADLRSIANTVER